MWRSAFPQRPCEGPRGCVWGAMQPLAPTLEQSMQLTSSCAVCNANKTPSSRPSRPSGAQIIMVVLRVVPLSRGMGHGGPLHGGPDPEP